MDRVHQRRDRRDVGRGHARPVPGGIAAGGHGRHDRDSGRGDVHERVVGAEVGNPVRGRDGVVGRGDRDDVVEGGGVREVCAPAVPRRCHDYDPGRGRGIEDRLERGHAQSVEPSTEAHADDGCAVGHRVVDPVEDVREVAAAGVVQDLDRHERDAGGDPGDADAVVGARGDGAGDMGPVAVHVGDVGRVLDLVARRDE